MPRPRFRSEVASLIQGRVWRQLKVRDSTHDLRIAAICIAYSARLITRNRRDFEQISELNGEIWRQVDVAAAGATSRQFIMLR